MVGFGIYQKSPKTGNPLKSQLTVLGRNMKNCCGEIKEAKGFLKDPWNMISIMTNCVFTAIEWSKRVSGMFSKSQGLKLVPDSGGKVSVGRCCNLALETCELQVLLGL